MSGWVKRGEWRDAGGVLVDANVLLDILTADPPWLAWSAAELRKAHAGGAIFVNPIVCAEIFPRYQAPAW